MRTSGPGYAARVAAWSASDPSIRGLIHVSGDVDADGSSCITGAVADLVASGSVPRVVLDLADVTFIDSSGLAALIHAKRAVSAAGASLVLRSVPEVVLKPLRITQLDAAFTIED